MCDLYKGINTTKYGVKINKPDSINVLKNKINCLKDAIIVEEQTVLNDRKDNLYTVVQTCEKLASEVSKIEKPVIIGGDHSIAMGSIKGVAKVNNGPDEGLGVLWIDAHADFNTGETTPTGNIHGMPLSALSGLGFKELVNLYNNTATILPKNIVILGTRDLEDEEVGLLNDNNVKFYSFYEVKEKGLYNVLEEINEYLKIERLHISFDLDSMDPEIIKGISVTFKDGFNREDVHKIFDYFNREKNVSSIDIVEYNSDNDDGNTIKFVEEILEKILKE